MSVVVMPAIFLGTGGEIGIPWRSSSQLQAGAIQAWIGLIGLTLVTFCSRLTLFLGVKHLGGLQTALLGLAELLVTLLFSYLWLHEVFTPMQWAGVGLLVLSLLLVMLEKPAKRKPGSGGLLKWLSPKVEKFEG
jgi:drug/metabolite transporter (DMT)-like permease